MSEDIVVGIESALAIPRESSKNGTITNILKTYASPEP